MNLITVKTLTKWFHDREVVKGLLLLIDYYFKVLKVSTN